MTKVDFSSRDQCQTEPMSSQTTTAKWPLDFKLKDSWRSGSQKRWHHWQYQGSKNEVVEVIYSKTKAESEVLAQKFLNEPILGFDMEW